MKITIRPALAGDAPGLFQVKEQIRLPADATANADPQDGFLLGTTLEQYQYFIEHDHVWVAERADPCQIVGFAIVLKHESVVNSVLWQRAQEVRWETDFAQTYDGARISFFEQLGFLPDHAYRVYAKYLAFASVYSILQTHAHLFTTIVREPFYNRASLSFIRVVGFESVGLHDEIYPGYGRIVSEVYHLSQTTFHTKLATDTRLACFADKIRAKGYLVPPALVPVG